MWHKREQVASHLGTSAGNNRNGLSMAAIVNANAGSWKKKMMKISSQARIALLGSTTRGGTL